MRKIVFLYGSLLALLIIILRFLEYRYIIRDLSLELYLGLVAILFMFLGVWFGLKIINNRRVFAPPEQKLEIDKDQLNTIGVSERESEVLLLMAKGFSNQEIADQLFVSLNTIKTHISNIYSKLDVRRRTQAIQKARQLQIINSNTKG